MADRSPRSVADLSPRPTAGRTTRPETDRSPRSTADRSPSLLVVALATFDTVGLVLTLVIAGHATGALSALLAELNTAVGVVIFLYLWVVVVLGLEWTLEPISLAESPIGTVALRGVGGGGLIGAAFLLGLLLVVGAPLVLTGSFPPYSFVLVVLIGTAIAVTVGAVIGLLFGLLNLGLYRLAGRLLPTGATDPHRL